MRRPRKSTRDLEMVLDELEAAGATTVDYDYGKHLKLRWALAGQERTTVIPLSPSDRRSALNTRSFVRQQIRELATA